VPVEALEDALPLVRRRLEALGAEVSLRQAQGAPFVTELGNRILDARFGAIADPFALAAHLDAIPGALDHGLFVGMAHLVLVGDLSSETVRRLVPERAPRTG
jgi:ribose 5-phosphate isomerase A